MRKQILERLLDKKRELDQRDKTIKVELARQQAKTRKLELEESELKGRYLRAVELTELANDGDAAALNLCPDCYIEGHKDRQLSPIPSDTKDDWLRCRDCGLELLVPSSI